MAEWQGEGEREDRWCARLATLGSDNLVARIGVREVGMASGVPADHPDGIELVSMRVSLIARRPRRRGSADR